MFQRVVIIGNLGRDPEMRYLPDGTPITSFSVATTEKYKDAAQQLVEKTTWFQCSAFGRTGEVCNQYLAKGKKVYVEGTLVADKNGGPRVFERRDGTHGAAFELKVSNVRFLSPANNAAGAGEQAPVMSNDGFEPVGPTAQGPVATEEELPF